MSPKEIYGDSMSQKLMAVNIDGEMIAPVLASVPVTDSGYTVSESVFETMRAYGNRILDLPQHVSRLTDGADFLGIEVQPEKIARWTKELVAMMVGELRLRITVSRAIPKLPDARVVITASRLHIPAMLRDVSGINLCLWEYPVPTRFPPKAKAGNYLYYAMAKDHATRHGYFDTLLVNAGGYVVEGATSNVFFVKQNKLITPGVAVGALSGITRDKILSIAQEKGLCVGESHIKVAEIAAFDAVFITNSVYGLLPVRQIAIAAIKDSDPVAYSAEDTVARDIAGWYGEYLHHSIGVGYPHCLWQA